MKQITYFWGDTTALPRPAKKFLATVRAAQPGYDVRLYDNDLADRWVTKHAPDFADLFASLKFDTARSDVFRLLVIRQEGGWYLDYGNVPVAPLTPIEPTDRALVFRRETKYVGRIVNGALFAPRPGIHFFELACNRVAEHFAKGEHRNSLPQFAGGKMLTELDAANPGLVHTESFEAWFKTDRVDYRKKRWTPAERHNWPELQKADIF